MKTQIEFVDNDQYGDFKKGERGYVDGYVFNGERPFVAVVTEKGTIVLAMTYQLKVVNFNK